jgi:MbtH protein
MNIEAEYFVVMNDEEQYSIWPSQRLPPPEGWRAVTEPMTKEKCLAHVRTVWTDQRPLSVRQSTGPA